MTEKNIRMVSYLLLILSLFIGNFYKVQADIDGFVKVEGVKGYAIVGDGIGFLLLLYYTATLSGKNQTSRTFPNRLFDWKYRYDAISASLYAALQRFAG
ncbi:hypothetical protein [Listeria booriae]|uniref:Uncharacterized protein n=1 Tax=Listeria booriae TaxID=1552123 RepID=A0A7X0XQS6_9LIST|nr:hypothetical protein [Listeria booriae]MBC1778939.1 hypothetical protein [Listeria booriae]